MSTKMQNINIRISPEFHERLTQGAKELGMTQSDFVRTSVEHMLEGNSSGATQNDAQTRHILDRQLQEKDVQIERMQVALGEQSQRHDTIVMQFTQQLYRAQLQIEDLRQKRSWWQRAFSR